MGDVALSFLLHELVEVLKWYKDLAAGAEGELNLLQEELRTLKAFLNDAANEEKKRNVFQEMERQVRDLVYTVEDMIADWLKKATAANGKSILCQCLAPSFISLAQQVKEIRLGRVKEKKSEVMNMTRTTVDHPPLGNQKDQIIRLNNLVGFEDEEEAIINYLLELKEKLDVISIIGMPGLGKTTLAWKIFQDKKIVDRFPTRIWIDDSKNFTSRDGLLDILSQSNRGDTSFGSGLKFPDRELLQVVRANLEKKTFLLVLDNVWSVDHWEKIKGILPNGNGKSKVLLTSCEMKVGRHANITKEPHMLPLLSSKKSWKLLQLEVFGDLESCPKLLKDIGLCIANQCGGVPLIIWVIGGILRDEHKKATSDLACKKEWTKVSENMEQILQKDEGNHISDVVGLSYNRLSHDLRDCFLYMGVFPENYEVSASTLARLWIAEGFIKPTGKTLEETAEQKLSELIEKNLLIVEKKKFDQVKTIRIHNMIHAFCRSKALEQQFFKVIKKSEEEGNHDTQVQKIYRLCVHSNLKKFLSVRPNGKNVRSFLYFCNEPVNLNPEEISVIYDAFSLLRVLDSKPIKLSKLFLDNIVVLTHLRYIVMSIDGLESIPKQIAQLPSLQTLIIETNSPSITMKANMWKMVQLRHIKTKATIVLDNKKWKGEAGENLQTLSRLSAESCTTAVLERAYKLKKLGIYGRFHSPENLNLVKQLSKIKRLTLSETFLKWDHMSTLAKINTLEVLKLKDYAFTGNSWIADGAGFECLEFLLIVNTDLVRWKVSESYFPSLRHLMLKSCNELREIPVVLAKNLEILDIDFLSRTAVESARRIEEEKKQYEGQQKNQWGVPFNLTIGPGCMQ